MGKIAGKLFVRWNFVMVSCGYFIGMFSYRFLSFDMDVMVSAYGFGPSAAGTCLAVIRVIGIISALSYSVYLGRTGNFRLIIIILSFGSTLAFACMAIFMPTKSLGMTMIGIVLGGFFIWPLYSTGIEYGVQLARPCSPEVVNGLIVSYGMVGGVISMYTIGIGYSSAISAMEKGQKSSTANLMGWILTGINALTILFALLIRSIYNT